MPHLEFPQPGDPEYIEAHEHARELERRRRRWKLVALVGISVLLIAAGLVIWRLVATKPVEVPDVLRKTVDEAAVTLQAAGLKVGDTSDVPTDSVAPGRVVSQKPSAGIAVDEGTKVDLGLAVEPQALKMPDLTGMTDLDARQTLEQALLVPNRLEMYSDDVAEGRVAGQLPLPDSPVITGSNAAYYVSLGGGAGGVTVPNVTGLVYTEAIERVLATGLGTQLFYENVSGTEQGQVVTQYPPAGFRLPEDGAVALLISVAATGGQ